MYKSTLVGALIALAIYTAPAHAVMEDDACGSTARVVGLDPYGDGFLSVRDDPAGNEIDRIRNGHRVYLCRYDPAKPWIGILYHPQGQECQTGPVHTMRKYKGPCRYGWVFHRYIGDYAG